MMINEMMYIVAPNVDDLTVVTNTVSDCITNNGGIVENVDFWGRKRLAYEIQDFCEGNYFLIKFSCNEPSTIKAVDTKLRQMDGVILRHMIIRLGE